MEHKLGVYLAPQHDWPTTWDYIQRLQPPVVRILLRGADAQIVSRVHQTAPGARIALRWWDIDDGGEGNKLEKLRSPEMSGAADAREVLARVERMEQDAAANGWPFPDRSRLFANALNETPIWTAGIRPKMVGYNRSFIAGLVPHRIPVLTGCINTGHPDEWPPMWDWFAPVIETMKMSPLSALELHSYWQLEGPNYEWTDAQGNTRRDWGALAGRYLHCPFDVPIVIGECGADGRLYDRKPDHTGWLGNMPAATYAEQLRWYHEQIAKDSRIIAMLPFLTDYQDDRWGTFDTTPAREEILAWATTWVQPATEPHTIYIPIVAQPGPTPPTAEPVQPQPVDGDDNWRRSMDYVRRWEGGWADNPADYGKATMKGITLATFTKWRTAHGMGVPTKDDLRAIADDEVEAILYQWYWLPSGAGSFVYPKCLVVFDSATLFGVDNAVWMRDEVADSALGILGLRLLSHLGQIERDTTQAQFWDGWKGRVMELRAIVHGAIGG